MNVSRIQNAVWERLPGALAVLALVAGALLRVAVWLQNRSLFIDEANLARNVCERNWAQLFLPLDYQQHAPPFFLLAQKLAVWALGPQELALRIFPLLCSLAGLALFYRIARKALPTGWLLAAALWAYAFSDFFVRYATEGKQYACDQTVALALIAWALWQQERPFRPAAAAALGAVAIWFSMPAVLVLFGAGLFFFKKYGAEGERRQAWQAAGAVAVWLLSFVLYYGLCLQKSLALDPLVAYHRPWFFPLPPKNWAELAQARDLLLSFPYYTAGFTVLALAVGAAGILTGLVLALRRRADWFFLLVLPLLTLLAVSALGLYSMIPRMLLWAFPLALLLQALGWQLWWQTARRWYGQVAVLLAIVPAVVLHNGFYYFFRPFEIEEIRPVLEAVRRDFQPGDVLYVSLETWPAVAFYRECHVRRAEYGFEGRVILGDWDDRPKPETICAPFGQPRRFWLVYSHLESEAARQQLRADMELAQGYARLLKIVGKTGAQGSLWEINAPIPPTLPRYDLPAGAR